MSLRSMSCSALALSLLLGGPALALESAGQDAPAHRPLAGLSALFGSRDDGKSYQVAQSADPKVMQLEELVRQLNGKVEELNFQILQMQEQIRKQNEDNEYRFQQLEQKKSDASVGNGQAVASAAPSAEPVRPTGPRTVQAPSPADDAAAASDDLPAAPPAPATGTAPAARDLGSITFDANGNPTGGTVLAPPDPTAGQDGAVVAALPKTNDPEELYRNSYELILSGDYSNAEAGFREHIDRFPKDQRAADAHFWLGESLLGQEKYRDAAEVFLAANKSYPKSRKAPDMLLKLGISLAAMNQRDVACATYAEIGKRYPTASGALKDRVKQEEALAGC